jgi:hypothetical protein
MGEYSSSPLSRFFFIKTIKKPRHNHHLFRKEKTNVVLTASGGRYFIVLDGHGIKYQRIPDRAEKPQRHFDRYPL